MAMDCIQAAELITRSVSGNATAGDEAELERHLTSCASCREKEGRIRRVWQVMGQLPQVALPASRAARVSESIAPRRATGLYWIAGLAAVAVISIISVALFHTPQPIPSSPTESAHASVAPPVDEPKREAVRDDAERSRVEGLLVTPDKEPAPEKPVVPQPEKEEPRKAPAPEPSPAVKESQPAVPAPPAPDKKAVAREDKPPSPLEKPIPAERETLPVAATLGRVQGSVFVVLAGSKSPAKAGQSVPAGAGIETAGSNSLAILDYEDGTQLALGADTVVGQVWDRHTSAGKPAEGKQIQLLQGVLAAQVVKQPAAEPMIFLTPHAEARVFGTRLSLTTTATSTRLDVRQGRVRLLRREDGAYADVTEGHYAVTGKGLAPVAKTAPGPKVFLLESFDHGKWSAALAQGGDASRGLRFSTEGGALSISIAPKPPTDATPVLTPPSGTPNPSTKLPPDSVKKAGDIVTKNLGGKGDLPRTLWLETRPTLALSNDTPLRIRLRLWQSNSDSDRSVWLALNRAVPGQAILLERRGNVLQLWSEAGQMALWKKELPSSQEWESVELWLTKDQIVLRRNDETVCKESNPLKIKTVQVAFGSSAKAELAQDEEVRFDHFELAWTTKADWEDVAR